MMNPAGRLSLALVVGLALSSPTIRACVRGDADVLDAATRYLVAFLLSWVSIAAVGRLFETYASAPVREIGAVKETPRRRADDEPSTASVP